MPSGQSYKAPLIITYVSRFINMSNLLVSMTLDSYFTLVEALKD